MAATVLKGLRPAAIRAAAVLGMAALALSAYAAFGRASVPAMGRVSVAPAAIDLGDIPRDGGPVSAEVVVTNGGDAPLRIIGVATSCGCTTADMSTDDLAPGESRTLTVTFDPAFHPDVEGPIIRVVYLQTSDPDVPETQIDVTGNVIPEDGV